MSQIEVDFAEQIGDLWYGRAARWLARYLSFFSFFDPVIEVVRPKNKKAKVAQPE